MNIKKLLEEDVRTLRKELNECKSLIQIKDGEAQKLSEKVAELERENLIFWGEIQSLEIKVEKLISEARKDEDILIEKQKIIMESRDEISKLARKVKETKGEISLLLGELKISKKTLLDDIKCRVLLNKIAIGLAAELDIKCDGRDPHFGEILNHQTTPAHWSRSTITKLGNLILALNSHFHPKNLQFSVQESIELVKRNSKHFNQSEISDEELKAGLTNLFSNGFL